MAISLAEIDSSTISQIEIGNTTYDIIDAKARATIQDLCSEVNSLTTKTTNLKSMTDATQGDGVSIAFGDTDTQNSYTLGLKTDTFLYGYHKQQGKTGIWIPVFSFKKLTDIKVGTFSTTPPTIDSYELYQIGHLVIGSLTLTDPNGTTRDDSYPYTLVQNLPHPSTVVKFTGSDESGKDVGFKLDTAGRFKWSIDTSFRSVLQTTVNILYYTAS